MAYVRRHSFWIDLKIVGLTLLAILKPGSKAVQEIRMADNGTVFSPGILCKKVFDHGEK
jgi:hypothetical protein